MALPKVIKQYNIFFQDGGWAGVCSEVELPDFMLKLDKFRGGGMIGAVAINMGVEQPEVGFTMDEQAGELIGKWGVSGTMGRFAAAMSDDSTVIPYEIRFTGTIHQMNLGNIVPGEKSPMKGKVVCDQITVTQGGTELIYIDMIKGICRAGGKDLYAKLSSAIQ